MKLGFWVSIVIGVITSRTVSTSFVPGCKAMTAEANTANKTIIIIPLNIDTRDIIRSANIATDSLGDSVSATFFHPSH